MDADVTFTVKFPQNAPDALSPGQGKRFVFTESEGRVFDSLSRFDPNFFPPCRPSHAHRRHSKKKGGDWVEGKGDTGGGVLIPAALIIRLYFL